MGAILRDKGAKKAKGAIGGNNNTKGAKMLNHYTIVELTSIAYYYDMLVSCKLRFAFIVGGCCYSNLSVKFLLWICARLQCGLFSQEF